MMREYAKETERDSTKEKPTAEEGSVAIPRLRAFLEELFWGGAGYVFGHAELLFGTFPLGMALLSATGGHTVSILLGLLLSALLRMEDPLIYICAYCAAALMRGTIYLVLDETEEQLSFGHAFRKRLRKEASFGTEESPPPSKKGAFTRLLGAERIPALGKAVRSAFSTSLCLRIGVSVLCSFVVLLYRVITGGFQYYDLFATLFALLITPAAVVIYALRLDGRVRDGFLLRFSEAALLFSAIWASAELTVFGFSFAAALGFFLTLLACDRRGAWQGIGAGLLCGVAYAPLYAPAFVLAALSYTLLGKRGRVESGAVGAIGGFLVWAVYFGGAAALLRLLPPILLAGTAFTVLQKLAHKILPTAAREEKTEAGEDGFLAGTRYRDANERFRGISEAFSSLSEMFYNLSDRFRRPGTLDLRRICDNAFDEHCRDCPNKTVCWGLEYAGTLSTVNALISRLHTRGRVDRTQIPGPLQHRCARIEEILGQINRDCAALTGEMLRNNRTEILAMDYEGAASIINDALEEDDGEYRFDPDLEQKVAEYLQDAGIGFAGVTVYGNRRRQILIRGADLRESKVTQEVLRADLGEMCGLELSRATLEVEGGVQTLILRARKKLSVIGAENNISADGGVSGDSLNLFSNKRDYFYALISDGMGAGTEAAFTSGLCSVFLEKMLRAGNRAWTSLRMLNNMIRSRGADSLRECSTTVDLLELDLMTGEASFIKGGAAPSFVVRNGQVQRVQTGTAPIGIIPALNARAMPFSLCIGDTVVLISDGVLPEDSEDEWLAAFLATCGAYTPEEIVYQICLHAAEREEHDDCSAIALRILGSVEG
ncbi:MAG: SpoIIE family protein phosphatase [Clostridia bacterium]|nr:SpoIIE family protein phosphatase [Clostridia bacterium]